MSDVNFRQDKVDAMKAVANPNELASKVQQLKDLEDEIANAEASVKKLKEKANILSQFEIPQMGRLLKSLISIVHLLLIKMQLFNGFVKTVEVILLKMILPLPLVVAKITRRHNMLSLQKVKDTNLSRK